MQVPTLYCMLYTHRKLNNYWKKKWIYITVSYRIAFDNGGDGRKVYIFKFSESQCLNAYEIPQGEK